MRTQVSGAGSPPVRSTQVNQPLAANRLGELAKGTASYLSLLLRRIELPNWTSGVNHVHNHVWVAALYPNSPTGPGCEQRVTVQTTASTRSILLLGPTRRVSRPILTGY